MPTLGGKVVSDMASLAKQVLSLSAFISPRQQLEHTKCVPARARRQTPPFPPPTTALLASSSREVTRHLWCTITDLCMFSANTGSAIIYPGL